MVDLIAQYKIENYIYRYLQKNQNTSTLDIIHYLNNCDILLSDFDAALKQLRAAKEIYEDKVTHLWSAI